MPIAQLVEPPIEIAAPVSSWCLVEPAHGEEDLAATAIQLLSNLRSRCSTTDNQDGTSWQLIRVAIVACMDLKEISWQVAAQYRNLCRLKRPSCHHDVLRLDDTANGLQDHGGAALCFAQRNDLGIAAHWGANYRRIVLKKTDELVLRSVPVGI